MTNLDAFKIPEHITLINRGNLKFWINHKVLHQLRAHPVKKNGRPFTHSEFLIEAMCAFRFKLKRSLRETEAFFQSLLDLMHIETKPPSYTQLYRRIKKASFEEKEELLDPITDVVFDTSGLQFYSLGKGKLISNSKTETWSQFYFAFNLETSMITLVKTQRN